MGQSLNFSSQKVLANTSSQEIGEFTLSGNSNEDVQLTNINVGIRQNGTTDLPLTSLANLRTSETSTPVPPSGTNSFSLSNDIVSANTTRTIKVYADVLSIPSTTSYTYATGTFAISGYFDIGDKASSTVGGTVYTFTSTAASTTGAYMASQLASLISASTIVKASATTNADGSGAVLVTSLAGGASTITLTTGKTAAHGTVGAANVATLAGGTSTIAATATIVTTLSAIAQGVTSHSSITINGNGANV